MLEESDFEGHTVLMHAAIAGSAPVFRVVYQSMASALANGEQEVGGRVTLVPAKIILHRRKAIFGDVFHVFMCGTNKIGSRTHI